MQRSSKEYVIWDSVTPQTVTSSTDASPTVVTKASHGLTTGDRIIINGHTTNIAVNGIWEAVVVNSNTFKIRDINTKVEVNTSGAGAGSGGVMATAPAIIFMEDYRNAILYYKTAGTSTHTVKVAGSIGKFLADQNSHGDTPNFGATIADSNPYSFVDLMDLEDGSTDIDGDDGIATSGTDFNKTLEVNVNGLKYFTLIPTAWTQGSISAKVKLFSNQ